MQYHTNKIVQLLRRAAAASLFLFATGAFALSPKIAPDLGAALSARSVSGITWARDTNSGRMVQVLVIADSAADPT